MTELQERAAIAYEMVLSNSCDKILEVYQLVGIVLGGKSNFNSKDSDMYHTFYG